MADRQPAETLVRRHEALASERSNLDGQLSLLERFVLPGKGRYYEGDAMGEQSIDWRHREIYDGTAMHANTLLASNLHSNLTSESATWFDLRFREDELNDDHEASVWLEASSERVRASLNDSNFALEVNEFYQDASGFGTAVLMHSEHKGPAMAWGGHLFKAETLRQCVFEEDMDGRPVALFVMRGYTALQLADRFGVNELPTKLKHQVETHNELAATQKHECLFAVYQVLANKDVDRSAVLPVARRPFFGEWILVEGRHRLGELQGYYTFPGYVLRWQRTAGSKYGHSPGLVALGDILTLQEMVELVRTATEKTVDPPTKSLMRGVIGDIELQAGSNTVVRDMNSLQPLMPPGAYRVDAGWQDIQDLRGRIERYFFVDQLQLKDSPQMTAFEVSKRWEMMQRLLGPTLGRIKSDLLDPLIENCFWMLYRKQQLPPMPEIVGQLSAELDIEYVGPLARAQRMHAVDGVERWLATVRGLAEVNPEVADVPDIDEIAKYLADVLGVPAKLARSQADIDEIREGRAKQAQEAQMLEQAQGLGRAAKDLKAGGMPVDPAAAQGMMNGAGPMQ